MCFLVLGILQAGVSNTRLVIFLAIGIALLAGFFFYIRARERANEAIASAVQAAQPMADRTIDVIIIERGR